MSINDVIPSVDFLAEGKIGQWAVEKDEITDADLNSYDLCAVKDPRRTRMRRPKLGPFTKLMYYGNIFPDVVMSDTEGEKWSHENFVRIATGSVLINGLGLGMALNAVLLKPDVELVHVVEQEAKVINLVGRQIERRLADGVYGSKKLIIYHDDAFTFKPRNMRYNVVWHDIWTDISADMLPDITRLKRKYARRLVLPGKWQGAWLEREVRQGDRLARKYGL